MGIVKYKDFQSFAIADIPGIIKDAHLGKGLGHKFLKHIERTELLFILIEAISENIEKDYEILIKELTNYSKILARKKRIIGISKIDLIPKDELDKFKNKIKTSFKEEVIFFSSVAQLNIDSVLDLLWKNINP